MKQQSAFVLSPFNRADKVYYAPLSGVINCNHIQPIHPFYFDESDAPVHIDYISLVKNAVTDLNKENAVLKKIVLARTKVIAHSQTDLRQVFKNICHEYPLHFCYLFTSSLTGTLIGATPETLLSFKNGKAKTVALAGTKAGQQIPWSEKEYNEHFWVQQHIENQLKKIQIRFIKKPVSTIKSGNLLHLSTDYFFYVNKNNIGLIIKKLNPTPAVAGLPVNASIDYIKNTENFNRNFYCGFIGVINFYNETRLFVNLRCGKVFQNTLQLYAGAGITKHSNPEKEFEETENKMNAIARFFVK